MLTARLLLAAMLFLLAACRPDSPPELPPRLKPLLETLPAHYRPFDRQDTLTSYWAPDSLLADSLFQFTKAHRSQVLLRVQFVPASVAAVAGLDTSRVRLPYSLSEEYALSEENGRPGYRWDFFPGRNAKPDLTETPDGVPLRLHMQYEWRLALTEYQGWPPGSSPAPRAYERNSYLVDYLFQTAIVARVSDSVAYVRAVPMLGRQPRPDTLYPYYHSGLHHKRIPFVADAPDTARHALLRLSFRVLSHSPNQD